MRRIKISRKDFSYKYADSADVLTFLLYFLTGVLFAVLFERLDNDYKTSAPMSIAVTIYVIEIAAGLIFQSHGTLTADELVIPITSTSMCSSLAVFSAKYAVCMAL